MTALLKRVKSHVNGQATSGQNTLSLTLDCIEHMRDNNNEWSALAYLIGKSQPAQSRMVRKITGHILMGWRMTKDDKQDSGLRFVKVKGANQGFDDTGLANLKSLIDVKASVQSKSVVETFTPDKAAPKTWEDKDAEKAADRLLKSLEEHGYGTGAFIALLQHKASTNVVEGVEPPF